MKRVFLVLIVVFGAISLSGSKKNEERNIIKSLDNFKSSLDSLNNILDESN